MKFYLFPVYVLLCAFFVFASPSSAQTPSPYMTVEVERFTVANGVEFPEKDLDEMMSALVLSMNRSRRFERVFLSGDASAQAAATRRAKVSGTITKYSKGSRAARYLVGFGAGRTKLVAGVKVIDAESGELLFEQDVDGHVYGGLFGGETDQAKGNMASEIVKTMTKKGYASKNRLKK